MNSLRLTQRILRTINIQNTQKCGKNKNEHQQLFLFRYF